MPARSSSSRRRSVSAGRRSRSPLMQPPLTTFTGELVGSAAAARREDAPRRGGGPWGVPPAGRRRRRPSGGPQPRTRAHPRDGRRRTWRPPSTAAAGARSEATRRQSVRCCLSRERGTLAGHSVGSCCGRGRAVDAAPRQTPAYVSGCSSHCRRGRRSRRSSSALVSAVAVRAPARPAKAEAPAHMSLIGVAPAGA
jgi:hypothetical protein